MSLLGIQKTWQQFRDWYKRHEQVGAGIAAGLLLLQLAHLTWLTTDVVVPALFDTTPLVPGMFWKALLVLADYTEIPAIIAASLLYLTNPSRSSLGYLLLINSQWLHLFWLTDELAIEVFTGAERSTLLPAWLAAIAVSIDYLEIPIILDTTRRFLFRR